MKQSLIIPGRLVSLNEYVAANRGKYGWRSGAAMAEQQLQIVEWAIARARLKPVGRLVHLRFDYFEKDRRRDKDNVAGVAHKFIIDGLVKMGILNDDNWNHVDGFEDHFEVDKENPRIEVTITEVET